MCEFCPDDHPIQCVGCGAQFPEATQTVSPGGPLCPQCGSRQEKCDMQVTVYYRAPGSSPRVFDLATRVDDTKPGAVVIVERGNYGEQGVTRIPWDLIARIETD
jgi:predicted RNA-binding Zn-ribbon protein involved in translation (DUF1610 family)